MIFAINQSTKRFIPSAVCTAAIAFFATFFCGSLTACADEPERRTVSADDYAEALNGAFGWELERTGGESLCESFEEQGAAGESESDWFVIAERTAGIEDSYGDYAQAAESALEARLENPSGEYLTEFARTAAAVGLCGGTAADLSALDFSSAGDNEVIWTAIALRINGGDTSAALDELYKRQADDGGFGLGQSDADVTAMALQALPQESAEAAKALGFLADYYAENSADISCETAAQLIIGLCAQGINPSQSVDFTDKNGVRPIDILLSFQSGGGFSHIRGEEPNAMSTMQAAAALAVLGYFSETGDWAWALGENFEPADVMSCENPIGEGFDDYDRALLESLEKPSAADYETLENLQNRAEAYGADDDTRAKIITRLEESEQVCGEIEDLNALIRESFYPAEKVGLGDLGKLNKLNAKISLYSDADRALILSADDLAAREDVLKRLRNAAAIGCAVGVIILAAIYINIKRKKKNG